MKKSFKYWTRDNLFKTLGLKVGKSSMLKDWLNHQQSLTSDELSFLNNLAERSEPLIDSWNEAELQQKFVNKVVDIVNFDMPEHRCTFFAERYLSATVREYTLYGFADWMVAEGVLQPSHPYFFMHEYKPEGEKQIDGRGQLLALMLAAKTLNDDEQPVCGCYVHGRMWFFVVLDDLTYEISPNFDATRKAELQQIACILKKQKEMILSRLGVYKK
jgi:hypothetical protein